jgi:hypothetical protein
MSHIVLKNGIGDGSMARVDKNHRLWTKSTLESPMSFHSTEGDAFLLLFDEHTIAADTETGVGYAVVTAGNIRMFIDKFWVQWNGGSTNYNRPLTIRYYVGATAPTANASAVTAGNLLIGSNNAASCSAYKWDGVGSGITVASQGVKFGVTMHCQGQTPVELEGAAILPYLVPLLITAESPEAGTLALAVNFWQCDCG